MDPSAGLRWCPQGFRGAVAVVNPWTLVLVWGRASTVFRGAVAVVNQWILVLV